MSVVFFTFGLVIGNLSANVAAMKKNNSSILNIKEMADTVEVGKRGSFCIEVDKREYSDFDDDDIPDDVFPEFRRWEQN